MRVHLAQLDIAWENKQANHRRVEALLADARVEEGDLIALPEMFDTGFSLDLDRTADTDGSTQRFLSRLADRLDSYVWAGFTATGADQMGRNRARLYGPDGEPLCQYDKIHPFSLGGESARFVGGDEVVTCAWRAGRESLTVCPAICYDLRFPELFRRGLSQGAELFVIGANWPAERANHWRSLLIARAIENQAFVVGVNRVGRDPHLRYAGGSIVISPAGDVLAEANDEETVLTVSISPATLHAWRDAFPAWRDRKPALLDR